MNSGEDMYALIAGSDYVKSNIIISIGFRSIYLKSIHVGLQKIDYSIMLQYK